MWDPAVFARSCAAVKSFRFVGITVKVLYIKAVHECVWDWLNKPCSRNGFECLNWVENCHWSTSPFLKNRSIWSHTHARFVCHTQKNIHAYSCDWEPQPWPLFPSPFWKGLLLYLPPWRRSLALGMGSYTPPPVYLTYLYKYNTQRRTHQCKVTQQLALIFQIKAQCDKQGHNTHMKWHSSLLSVVEGESSGHPTVTLSFTVVI